MENKLTAVEWLIDQLERHKNGDNQWFSEVATKNHALRMEKEQIMKAYERHYPYSGRSVAAELYYNKTYGSQAPQRLNEANGEENDNRASDREAITDARI